MTNIIAMKIPESIDLECYELLKSMVSAEKRDKINRFYRIRDSYRSLLGELLVRAAACIYTGKNNEDICFISNSYGKPALKETSGFSFNLSHSGNWVTVIWSEQQLALGVDVEKIKPMEMDIAERFFAETEVRDLKSRQGVEQLEYFIRLWTLKESYIKAQGMGLSIPLDSFSLCCRNDGVWFSPEARQFHFKSFRVDAEHFLSACSDADNLPDDIHYSSFEDLCGYFGC